MIRIKKLAPLLLAALTHTGAAAQDAEAETNAAEAAIAALQNGDLAAARRMISAVEGFGGGEQLFGTPAEAIGALAGCDADLIESIPMRERQLLLYEWDCGRRTYSGGIAENDDPRSVRLVHILEGNGATTVLRQLATMAAPPPVQMRFSSPEAQAQSDQRRSAYARELDKISLRKGERFAQLLVDGSIETLAAGVNEYSTISYGFQHPELSEIFIEMNGMDSEALVAQIEHIYATLGQPTGYACEIGDRVTECIWQFANPDYELNASISGCCTDRWLIGDIQFGYSAPEIRAEFGLAND